MDQKKILVIEDSKMVLKDITNRLSEAGYRVIPLEKAVGASAVVIDEKPDLIILDIKIPGLSGEELLGIMRNSLPRVPPILAFSELDRTEIERICREKKVDGFLQKSEQDQLLVKVRELLKSR